MKRYIFQKLMDWKKDEKRKPLILMGARQVGKTYILKKLAASAYEHSVYMNFEDKRSLRTLFHGNLEPTQLIQLL